MIYYNKVKKLYFRLALEAGAVAAGFSSKSQVNPQS